MEELTNQALTAGEVGVSFHPHAAFRLPAAFTDTLADLFKEFRMPFLEEDIQLGLTGHEAVMRILVHELEDGGKRAAGFFTGLRDGPPPGHVNVCMSDAAGNDFIMPPELFIEVLPDIGGSLPDTGIIGFGIRLAQIQQVDRVIDDARQIHAAAALLIQAGKCPKRNLEIPVEAVDFRVHLPHFRNEAELRMKRAGIALQFDMVGLAGFGAPGDEHFPVVHIHALGDFPVHKEQELRILGIIPLLDLGAEMEEQGFSIKRLGHGHIRAEPVVLVGSVPVHGPPVKGGEGGGRGERVGGRHEIALLHLP